ncbi:extracellular ribonuclease LE-like [Aristolochia californica]|uniref:extracellular ribonuclease LE-like n=1 Tax=Aristolochia californica TaxID=171875 RepID=UPI0035E3AA31
MTSLFAAAALLSLFGFSHAVAAADPAFHYLVLMWPGSYCKKSSSGCCFPKDGLPALDFFVKGLYPFSSDGKPLVNCNQSPFYLDQVADLTEELSSYWANIKCPSSEGRQLWESTWKTYGGCSGLSQHDYFKKGLDLRSKIDLLSLLNKNGIVSTDYMDYSIIDVLNVVSTGIRANAAIECSKNAWDESIVYEVYLCVDKDATTIVPCPVLPGSSCAARVVLGAYTYDLLKNETAVNRNLIKMRLPRW